MTAPRFYSWDDDGSPGRALTGNLQNRLKQILVACLVNGYGSKPGAGWTLEHEHANGFTLSNGDAYVNFVSNLPANAPYPAMSPWAIHLYAAESIQAGHDGPVIRGLNVCSGPYRDGFSEVAGYPRHGFEAINPLSNQMSSMQWTLIADEKTFSISVSSNNAATLATAQFTLYIGSIKSQLGLISDFIMLGGSNAVYSSGGECRTLCGGFTSLRDLSTGALGYTAISTRPFAMKPNEYPALSFSGPVPSEIRLRSPVIFSGDGYVGDLRGVVYDDIISSDGWPTYLRSLGFSGGSFADRGKVLTVGDFKYAYIIGYGGGFVMTNDPAFW